MEVDDDSFIVDLSISSRRPDSSGSSQQSHSNKRSPSPSMGQYNNTKRSLRPRTEVKNYVETTDIVVVSDTDEYKQNGYMNGYDYSDSDEGELPPLPPIKELSAAERMEAEKKIRLLKDELRNEEMKLVLLKKLRQSQQMKENISIVPIPNTNIGQPVPPTHNLSNKLPSNNAAHRSSSVHHNKPPSAPPVPPLLRGVSPKQLIPPNRPNVHHAPPPLSPVVNNHQNSRSVAPGMPPNMFAVNSVPGHRGSSSSSSGSHLNSGMLSGNSGVVNSGSGRNVASMSNSVNSSSYQNSISLQDRIKDVPQSTVISSVSPSSAAFSISTGTTQQDRRNEDAQTPAQRQAAAKLALRKQLEKTLLQIPPPKPPPPEMHFIPNPSNTEFIYLLGLEHVVDYITKDQKTPSPPEPFQCSQCNTSFTPIWKWEKNAAKGKEPKVICEACVTSNVKKALKAEHTNRLKTAFVKALQQEQEIEQRLAQVSPQPMEPPVIQSTSQSQQSHRQSPQSSQSAISSTSQSLSASSMQAAMLHNSISAPAPPPPPPPNPKSSHSSHSSHSSMSRHNPTPPIPQPSPTPPRDHPLAKLASESNKFSPHHAAAALHQQLLRGLPSHQPLPAHMIPFSPLLYPYQLAMAQAANSKNPMAAAASLAELQRQAADLQRQYLLDMIPAASANANSRQHSHSINNWKS